MHLIEYFDLPPTTNNSTYVEWLDKVELKKSQLWKTLRTFDLTQLSRIGPNYDVNLLLVAIHFWEGLTYTI